MEKVGEREEMEVEKEEEEENQQQEEEEEERTSSLASTSQVASHVTAYERIKPRSFHLSFSSVWSPRPSPC